MPRLIDFEREYAECMKPAIGQIPTFTCSECGAREFRSYYHKRGFRRFDGESKGGLCRHCYWQLMNSRRGLLQRQPSEYRAAHKAKVDAKLAEGNCRYVYCDEPLAPTSKHYCVTHLAMRTQRQRDKRNGGASDYPQQPHFDPWAEEKAFARTLGISLAKFKKILLAKELEELFPKLYPDLPPIDYEEAKRLISVPGLGLREETSLRYFNKKFKFSAAPEPVPK